MAEGLTFSDDDQLLCELREGGETGSNALARLYRQNLALLHSSLMRLDSTLTQYDREDLAQQVFVEFWRNRNAFRGECSAAHYLVRIATNLLSKHHRSESRRLHLEAERRDVSLLDDEVDMQRCEASELVHFALEQLPRAQREAVHLVFLQDKTIAEAAGMVGCSYNAMKKRLACGKQFIEKRLRGF